MSIEMIRRDVRDHSHVWPETQVRQGLEHERGQLEHGHRPRRQALEPIEQRPAQVAPGHCRPTGCFQHSPGQGHRRGLTVATRDAHDRSGPALHEQGHFARHRDPGGQSLAHEWCLPRHGGIEHEQIGGRHVDTRVAAQVEFGPAFGQLVDGLSERLPVGQVGDEQLNALGEKPTGHAQPAAETTQAQHDGARPLQ